MKEGVYNKENIKQADRCSFVTLVAYYGAFPMKSGNCFAVISGDVEYKDAELSLQIFNIYKVCKGRAQTAGGFKWKYKQNDQPT